MQERKKYKIERVYHNIVLEKIHNCCIVDYYIPTNRSVQLNYTNEDFAKTEITLNTIGMWRIKQINKITKNKGL